MKLQSGSVFGPSSCTNEGMSSSALIRFVRSCRLRVLDFYCVGSTRADERSAQVLWRNCVGLVDILHRLQRLQRFAAWTRHATEVQLYALFFLLSLLIKRLYHFHNNCILHTSELGRERGLVCARKDQLVQRRGHIRQNSRRPKRRLVISHVDCRALRLMYKVCFMDTM